MSFFCAICALIFSTFETTSSRSCFSAMSMQPTVDRTRTAGIANIRVFISCLQVMDGREGGNPAQGQGLYRSGREEKTPESGFQDKDFALAADDLAHDARLLAGLPQR